MKIKILLKMQKFFFMSSKEQKITNAIKQIRFNKNHWVLFSYENREPSTVNCLFSDFNTKERSYRPTENEISEEFNKMIQTLDKDSCCHIIHDMKYYVSKGAYRSALLFIIYIPKSSSVKDNFFYSSFGLAISNEQNLPLIYTIKDFNDFTYENIKNFVLQVKKN